MHRYTNYSKTASPLHYIFQAAMGQCSTLPADKNGKGEDGRNNMSPATHSSRRSFKQQRQERESYHEDSSRRQADGDVVMDAQYSQRSSSRKDMNRMMNSAKETNQKFEPYMEDQQGSQFNSGGSSRSSSRVKRGVSSRRSTATPVEFFPPPPEGAVRTRCYRLNLDVPAVLSPTHDSLGPFFYAAPSHLVPTSHHEISHSMSDESVEKSSTQIAVDTARIFRGIKVDNNGTIVGRNDRASRSRRSQNTSKTAENSRQSAKITKANDLVDEMIAAGKENDGQKQNLISIIPIGEYDDMKQLVRDGSKKLREAEFKGDESILVLNRSRGSPKSRRSGSDYPGSPNSISRRRLSNCASSSMPPDAEMSNTPRSSSSRSKSRTRKNLLTSAPPKLKSNPRDRPSSRRGMDRAEERNPRYGEKCNNISLFGGGDSDWSEALNFNSIWNCGGTGTGTMSPSNNNGKSMHRTETPRGSKVRYEGRNESNTRFSKGTSERDAPVIL